MHFNKNKNNLIVFDWFIPTFESERLVKPKPEKMKKYLWKSCLKNKFGNSPENKLSTGFLRIFSGYYA